MEVDKFENCHSKESKDSSRGYGTTFDFDYCIATQFIAQLDLSYFPIASSCENFEWVDFESGNGAEAGRLRHIDQI